MHELRLGKTGHCIRHLGALDDAEEGGEGAERGRRGHRRTAGAAPVPDALHGLRQGHGRLHLVRVVPQIGAPFRHAVLEVGVLGIEQDKVGAELGLVGALDLAVLAVVVGLEQRQKSLAQLHALLELVESFWGESLLREKMKTGDVETRDDLETVDLAVHLLFGHGRVENKVAADGSCTVPQEVVHERQAALLAEDVVNEVVESPLERGDCAHVHG